MHAGTRVAFRPATIRSRNPREVDLSKLPGYREGVSTSEPWMVEAVCAQTDPDTWFPGEGESPGTAKRICRRCPVRDECLAYALAHDESYGVWGGLSERERRALKRHGV